MGNKTDTITRDEIKIALPGKYNVIFHNDDITPMQFVVELLENIFELDQKIAVALMLKVHSEGKAVVGTYIKSIAEAKVTLCRDVSIKANYPLQVTMEKE